MLVAVGDSLGSQRADNQLLDRALSAAVTKGAKQFILVTPLGGGGGGGLFGGLFGGGGGSSKQPSKIERQVCICLPCSRWCSDGYVVKAEVNRCLN